MVDLTELMTERQQEEKKSDLQPEPGKTFLSPEQLKDRIGDLGGTPKGFVPIPNNIPGQAEGSLWLANFTDSTSIGSFIASSGARELEPTEVVSTQELIQNIPEQHLDHADKYVGIKLEDFPIMSAAIDRQESAKQLINEHPYASFAIGLVEQPLDPINWLPFGAIYKNAKRGSRLARSIIGSGAAGALGALTQEAVISRNQEARSAEESAYNIITSGLLGATLGGIGSGLTIKGRLKSVEQRRARNRLRSDIMDTLTEQDKELTPQGLLKDEDLANMSELSRKAMLSTPMNRLAKSEFGFSKWFANTMYENNYTLNKNLDGKTKEISVERRIRKDTKEVEAHLVSYDDIYYESIGISKGPFKGTRTKLAGITGDTKAKFDTDVWTVLSTDIDHENEHVNRAAKLLRDNVFEPAKNKLIDLVVLPEEVRPRNAANYVMSVYAKDLIIEQGGKSNRNPGSFPHTLHTEYRAIRNEVQQFKESPLYKQNQKKIDAQKQRLSSLEEQKKSIPKTQKARLKKVNDAITKAKESIKELEQNLKDITPEKLVDSEGKLFPIVDDDTLWARVDQTIDNILGDNEGKLVNPILSRLKSISANPVKERKMTVEQVKLREWQITNMPKLADMYVRATSPIIHMTELAQKNGAKDVNEFKTNLEKLINDEFDEKVAGKTGKEAQKLRKMRDDNLKDIAATFELMEGVYGDGPNVLNDSAKKFYQNFLKWNATRLLGSMTLSSIPDAGLQIFTHGYYRFMHDGILKSFSEARNIAKQDLNAIGYAMETVLGSRIQSYQDTQGLSTNPGPFTRGLDALTKNFGNLSLMNQWNNLMQEIAGHIGINRTLQTIHKVVKGEKVSDKEILRLNKLGIERKNFDIIFEYTKNNDSDGTLFADWTNWDIQTKAQREALEQFQATVGKEIDEIVIVPGLGDKPLFARSPLGRLLFQFKTFLMAATNRVVVPAIQNKGDINTYLGITSMIGFGALSYIATTLVKGKELDLSFDNMAKESIDRSGITAIYGELYNIGAKTTGLGVTSRYQSRNAVGAWLGPSYGAASELVQMLQTVVGAATGEKDVTTKDVDKFMRLFPLQNLATSLEIPKKLIKGGAKNLGAIDVDD